MPALIRTFFWILFSGVFLVSNAFAFDANSRYVSAYNSEYGLKLMHDGKLEQATERFVKSLLLDPANQTARKSLKELAGSLPVTEEISGPRILRFLDQLEYLQFLNERYKSIANENTRLRDFLGQQSALSPDLKLQAQNIEGEAQKRLSQFMVYDPTAGVPVTNDQAVKLSEITNQLNEKKKYLLTEIDFWEGQNRQLRAIRNSAMEQGMIGEAAKKLSTQIEAVQERLGDKDKLLFAQRQNTEYFQKELAAMRDNFNLMQDKLKNTDERVASLTKQIADMSMEIIEKDKTLSAKDLMAKGLEQQLTEAQEKLNLVQRIMQEKDDRIALLEKDMSQVQNQMAAAGSDPGTMAAIKSNLQGFQSEMKKEMEKSREKIIDLQTQLIQLSSDYQALNQIIEARNAEIVLLNSSLKSKDVAVKQYRQAFLANTEKLSQMDAIVELYRGRLLDTQATLKAKNDELIRLQATLSQEHVPSDPFLPIKPETTPSSLSDLTFSKKGSTVSALLE